MAAGALAAGILLMSILFISSIFRCANAVDAPNAAARTNVVMATLFMGISVSEWLKEMGVSIRASFLSMSLTASRAPPRSRRRCEPQRRIRHGISLAACLHLCVVAVLVSLIQVRRGLRAWTVVQLEHRGVRWALHRSGAGGCHGLVDIAAACFLGRLLGL